jgi:hypothetical protein
MNVALQAQVTPVSAPSFTPVQIGLQRKCASNDCEERRKKKLTLQRSSTNQSEPSEVPPIILEVLSSPGQPLDPEMRPFMEPRFGHDFSKVRVHTDAKAAESVRAVNALAYTVGQDVVFGDGQYVPSTHEGRRLIAHELMHVVQQGFVPYEPNHLVELAPSKNQHEREVENATVEGFSFKPSRVREAGTTQLVQRQRATEVTPDPTRRLLTDDQKTRINSFLQMHQVMLLRKENHAWLDGQRTTIGTVIARVRRDAHILLPDDDVIASYIDSQSYRARLQLQLPPGIRQPETLPRPLPAVSLFPESQHPTLSPNLVLGPHLMPEDRQRILSFLSIRDFHVGPGLSPMFGGLATTVDAVIELMRQQVLPIIPREEVAGLVEAEWSRLLLDALRVPLPPPPPITIPLEAPTGLVSGNTATADLQSAVGGQWTWHLPRISGVERTVQVSLTRGAEAYQFSVNLDTRDAQVLVGAQLQKETPAIRVLSGTLKASVFLLLLSGITTARGEASGALTVQVQAGVQVTVTFGPVTVSVQAAPSLTLQAGQDPSLDFNVAPQGGATPIPHERPFPPLPGIPFIQGHF